MIYVYHVYVYIYYICIYIYITYVYIYILHMYIYIHMCVCVEINECVCDYTVQTRAPSSGVTKLMNA